MPPVELHPGKSLELSAESKVEVQNRSDKEGDFTIAFISHPVIVKHSLKSKHHVSFVVAPGGEKITNDGHVPLTIEIAGA